MPLRPALGCGPAPRPRAASTKRKARLAARGGGAHVLESKLGLRDHCSHWRSPLPIGRRIRSKRWPQELHIAW
eukprot:3008773-Alexandrium_andersonii.AAC.1